MHLIGSTINAFIQIYFWYSYTLNTILQETGSSSNFCRFAIYGFDLDYYIAPH